MLNIGISPKLFINASIFLFFTLLLMFPKGYNYGSTALLVLSVFYFLYKSKIFDLEKIVDTFSIICYNVSVK